MCYSLWCNAHPTMLPAFGMNLITGLTSAASPRVDISSTCKLGQKVGVSLPLMTCSPSACPSRPLYAEVGNPGGTYELLCIFEASLSFPPKIKYILSIDLPTNYTKSLQGIIYFISDKDTSRKRVNVLVNVSSVIPG